MIEWKSLDFQDFPKYVINQYGDIRNENTGRPIARQRNQRGHVYVSLYDIYSHRRNVSVGLLTATAFVHNPNVEEWTSVTYKDGDRTNTVSTNLVWRTRSYSIRHHRQMQMKPEFDVPVRARDIRVNALDEPFASVREAGVYYGILDEEIMKSATRGLPSVTLPHLYFELG